MRRLLSLVLVVMLLLSSRVVWAAEPETQPRDAEGPTIWPAHVGGAIGILGLGTALAFGSLQINAEHAARVTEATLARAGASPGSCRGADVRPELGQMCSLLARHEAASEFHQDAFAVALGVGLTSLAFAVTWYLIAK